VNGFRRKAPRSPGGNTSNSTSGTVSRALQLLTVLADPSGAASVKHVAEQLQLAPSTAHHLLQLLCKDGFVEAAAEGRQYSIGPQSHRVAARVVSLVPPPDIAQSAIEAIADACDETVVFGLYLPMQGAVSFTARADGKQRLKYQIDMRTPLSLIWGASGKATLAYLPADAVHTIYSHGGRPRRRVRHRRQRRL
jgi:DNA-binding IclR family transcriptional regulator